MRPDVTAERQVIDIFLQPGDYYFGDADTRIRTVLGSCVAITMWHPVKRVGGMCHYMLPTRPKDERAEELDGRYGDEAIQMFLKHIRRLNTSVCDYEVKLFGGGNMFPGTRRNAGIDVGRRNVELGLYMLKQHGFRLKNHHSAGNGHRNVVFELWSGDVWLRHSEIAES